VRVVLSLCILLMAGCSRSRETDLAQALEAGTGTVDLPAGTLLLHRELVIPEGARPVYSRTCDVVARVIVDRDGCPGLDRAGLSRPAPQRQ